MSLSDRRFSARLKAQKSDDDSTEKIPALKFISFKKARKETTKNSKPGRILPNAGPLAKRKQVQVNGITATPPGAIWNLQLFKSPGDS